MKRIGVIGLTALALLASTVADAPAQQQQSGTAALLLAALAAGPSASGAFESLSAAHQRTARVLHAAQRPTTTRVKLTLDQIAARRQSGQGWGEIFNVMKAYGLVKERTIRELLGSERHARVDEGAK